MADQEALAALRQQVQQLNSNYPPEVWFRQIEVQFSLARITLDRTCHDYIVIPLDSCCATELRNILTSPPADNCFLPLKTELIRQLSPSEDQEVCQLLQHEKLGDCKPSQFLCHMRALAGNTWVDDSLLRTIWLQRLLSYAQAILQVQPNLPLDQLAQITVSLPTAPLTVHAVSAPQPTLELARHIDITCQLNSIQGHLDQRPQSRPCNRSQSYDRNNDSS
ncbi:uncharacterized protein LOC142575022 [Dermacentor variabilis]|uniref:uncharacterized protein LOC142575022 n=1 Tax=Dermacentor variabilis TaxID=34621 RepID=UPI003F5BB4AF